MKVSVIIPVGQRCDSLQELHASYRDALASRPESIEFNYVLDGPRPTASQELQQLRSAGEPFNEIQLARPFGEATALMAGIEHSDGELILTLPAYHQVEAAELPKLFEALSAADMVIARRWPRRGSAFEGWRRAVFHSLLAAVTRERFSDLGCSVRLFGRAVAEEITVYGDQHRFLPLLVQRQGFKVVEIDARQSPLDRFEGHYAPREYLHRILDILTVFFLVRFTKKPLRFFGMIGTATSVLGFAFLAYIVIERIFGRPLADRPALLLSSLLVVLGLQIFGLGLLGELIIFTHARQLKEYRIDKIIN